MAETEVIRLCIAAALGGIIGFERELGERSAGLRTHALVATASALIMLVSAYGFNDIITPRTVVLDPSRVAAQVVSGVGFLGAGTIIFRKNVVRGLTTAASIWLVAGIGLACGVGFYLPAITTTVIALVILSGLRPVERRIFEYRRLAYVTISIDSRPGQVAAIEEAMGAVKLPFRSLQLRRDASGGMGVVTVTIRDAPKGTVAPLLEQLRFIPGVRT